MNLPYGIMLYGNFTVYDKGKEMKMTDMEELRKSINILWVMYVQASDRNLLIKDEIHEHLSHLLEVHGEIANKIEANTLVLRNTYQ